MTAVASLVQATSRPTGTTNYALRINCTTADTSLAAGDHSNIRYRIEGYDISQLIGKVCTLSFWVRSNASGTYSVGFSNTGNDICYVSEYTIDAGDAWQFKTITFTMHDLSSGTWDTTNGIGLAIRWGLGSGSTYQTSTLNTWQSTAGLLHTSTNQTNFWASNTNYFFIKNVQLEVGSVATQFEYRPFSEELALCQRYYEKSYSLADAPRTVTLNGEHAYIAPITGTVYAGVQFKVSKRIALTSSTMKPYSVSNGDVDYVRNITAGTNMATTAVVISENACIMQFTGADGHLYAFQWTADAEL